MTKLLVSVRDVEEARTALEAGVDLIDLKEPNHGALGAVDLETVRAVVALRDAEAHRYGVVPLSMALGELVEREDRRLNLPQGLAFAKVGLKQATVVADWPAHLFALQTLLPPETGLVAVVYADGPEVSAPSPDAVLREASALKARAVLVDTALKDGRTLFDHWDADGVRRFVDEVRALGMTSVVGGGLTLATIPRVVDCGADYVAVRGAACVGGRTSMIDAGRIQAIRALLPRSRVCT